MKKHLVDERKGILYTLIGDYYLPWGDQPDDEVPQAIGIWGQRHLRYIMQHKRLLYTKMLNSGRLNAYLAGIDAHAEEMFSRLVEQMVGKQGATEKLNAGNQILLVGRMNNIRAFAKEIINKDLIYALY